MPEISRSDSQRSDSSIKPRVSFNRDVHIKKIGHPDAPSVVGALAGDGEGHLVPTAVRREGPSRLSRRELAKEAEKVLKQAESVVCVPISESGAIIEEKPSRPTRNHIPHRSNLTRRSSFGGSDNKHELSSKKQGKPNLISSVFNSLDRSKSKKKTEARENEDYRYNLRRSSLHDDTGTNSLPRSTQNRSRTRIGRSVSDAGSRKPLDRKPEEKKTISIFATLDRLRNPNRKAKPHYAGSKSDVEVRNVANRNGDVIDYSRTNHVQRNPSPVVAPRRKKKQLSPIIEITPREDYFESSSEKHQPYSLGGGEYESLGRRPRDEVDPPVRKQHYSLGGGDYESTERKPKAAGPRYAELTDDDSDIGGKILATPSPTRAPTIDKLIQKLSEERRNRAASKAAASSSPLVEPDEGRQHNDNKPFSYTEPPTKADADGGHVIYAQVVASGGVDGKPAAKQTVHATVSPNRLLDDERSRAMGQDRASPTSRIPEPEKILNLIRAQSKPVPLEPESYKPRTETFIRIERDDPFGTRGRGDGMELNGRRNSSFDRDDLTVFREKYGSLLDKRSPSLNETDIGWYSTPARNLSHRRNLLESKIEDKQRRLTLTAGQLNLNNQKNNKLSELLDDTSDLTKNRYFETKLVHESSEQRRHSLKKDVSDSGVELSDYRKESLNGYARKIEPPPRAKLENKALYHQRVVSTRTHSEVPKVERPPRSKLSSKSFSATKTVQEKKREAVPSGATLVRRYSQNETTRYRIEPKTAPGALAAPEKKLTKMEKVKQFFGVNAKKKRGPEEVVVQRYREYKGSDTDDPSSSEIRRRASTQDSDNPTYEEYYAVRQRLATPSPRPPSEATTVISNSQRSHRSQPHISDDRNTWFKSLDRLTHKNKTKPSKAVSKLRHNAVSEGSENDDEVRIHHISSPRRSSDDRTLRFSESEPEMRTYSTNRKYNTDSSPDSNTEGDSRSSQKSVVYLHATTVGDIPGSKKLHSSVLSNGRRAMSREELSSNNSVSLSPQKRTLSRSISVLAPWRPKHPRESLEIDYSQDQTDGKPPKPPLKGRAHSGASTVKSRKNDQENLAKNKQGKTKNIFGKLSGKNKSVDQPNDEYKTKRRASNDLIFTGKKENWDSYLGKSIDSFHDYRRGSKSSGNKVDYTSSNSLYDRSRKLSDSTTTTDYPYSRKYSTDASDATSKLRPQSRNSSEYIIPVVRFDPNDSDESKRHILVETLGKKRNSKQKEDSEKLSRSTSFPKDSKFTSGWFKPKNKV
nr:PREDICTED: uncharacterized protein LOC109037461 [Bemisia tabaci]